MKLLENMSISPNKYRQSMITLPCRIQEIVLAVLQR